MDYVYALVALLSGLGALLVGFKLLSDNIEKLANSGIKKLFNKIGKSKLVGVGIGAGVTAIIQSSGATTIMIIGFVNAGIMTLSQATCMIMGANIGTTITAQIVALEALDISKFFMLFSVVGIFMAMLCKKNKVKTIGLALAGLGLVFISLDFMSSAMDVFKESEKIVDILSKCNNPFLLLIIGIVFTALIQSSSATTTILIQMVGAGIAIGTSSNAVYYVVLGSNIGTCVTALLSSIGTSTNAKRTSIIHLLFNVIGTIIFFIMLLIWKDFGNFLARMFKYPGTQIAMFHTFFNTICTILFLPISNLFVKMACIIIPSKKSKEETQNALDERLLQNSAIALGQVKKVIYDFGKECMETLNYSIDAFLDKNDGLGEDIDKKITKLDVDNKDILSYMVKISSNDASSDVEAELSKLHHIINDFYREAEIADNMKKYTKKTVMNNLEFSDDVYDKIKELKELLNTQFTYISELFENNQYSVISDMDNVESKIDTLRSLMINNHIARLERGECSPSNSGVYINLVSNLERAGDHLNYIGHAIVD